MLKRVSPLQTWYPDSFTSSNYNSYSVPSDGQRVVKLHALADTGMKVIQKVDERLKSIEEEKRRNMERWGFLETMDDTPYRISTNSPDLGKVIHEQVVRLRTGYIC